MSFLSMMSHRLELVVESAVSTIQVILNCLHSSIESTYAKCISIESTWQEYATF